MKTTAILDNARADEVGRGRETTTHRDHPPISQAVSHNLSAPAAPTRALVGPVVVGVRGPSRCGKTAMCQRLIAALSAENLRVGWIKRTHHSVDTPGKASDRIWSAGPAATALRASDRLQITLPPGTAAPVDLIASLPSNLDIILIETHEPVDHPVLLSNLLNAADGEVVLGGWDLFDEDSAVAAVLPPLRELLPADRMLDQSLRAAIKLHGGHACAGTILGTRLAITAADALGLAVPDTEKRLVVVSETERCAVDGIQAVTGCRPGKRTLRILDYGKLAATFLDDRACKAVRVAARGDLRERVGAFGSDRYEVQRQAYIHWPAEELFIVREVPYSLSEFDRPGSPKARVICVACREEVSDGRHVDSESGPTCRPCWAAAFMETKGARQ